MIVTGCMAFLCPKGDNQAKCVRGNGRAGHWRGKPPAMPVDRVGRFCHGGLGAGVTWTPGGFPDLPPRYVAFPSSLNPPPQALPDARRRLKDSSSENKPLPRKSKMVIAPSAIAPPARFTGPISSPTPWTYARSVRISPAAPAVNHPGWPRQSRPWIGNRKTPAWKA